LPAVAKLDGMTAPRAAAHAPDPRHVVALLADPVRLRVFAALVLATGGAGGAGGAPEAALAGTAAVPQREAAKALARFEQAGLAARDGAGWRATPERLRAATESIAGHRDDEVLGLTAPDPSTAALLRGFFTHGRLTQMPSRRSKRLAVLDYIAGSFEPGQRYSEAEVNAALARFHDDVAMLRRYLVDDGFMDRAAGAYWRSGGTVAG
jgi:hypothetical protein